MVWPCGSRTDGLKVTYTRAFTSAYFRKSKLAEQTLLQIGRLRGTPFGFLRRRESAHERQHLHVMGVNVDKRRTLFAAASDRPAAIHIRVESGWRGHFPRHLTLPILSIRFIILTQSPGRGSRRSGRRNWRRRHAIDYALEGFVYGHVVIGQRLAGGTLELNFCLGIGVERGDFRRARLRHIALILNNEEVGGKADGELFLFDFKRL